MANRKKRFADNYCTRFNLLFLLAALCLCGAVQAQGGPKLSPVPGLGLDWNSGHFGVALGTPNDTVNLTTQQKQWPHLAILPSGLFFWNVVAQKWDYFNSGSGAPPFDSATLSLPQRFALKADVATLSRYIHRDSLYTRTAADARYSPVGHSQPFSTISDGTQAVWSLIYGGDNISVVNGRVSYTGPIGGGGGGSSYVFGQPFSLNNGTVTLPGYDATSWNTVYNWYAANPLAPYSTTAQVNTLLAAKQNVLGYTPVRSGIQLTINGIGRFVGYDSLNYNIQTNLGPDSNYTKLGYAFNLLHFSPRAGKPGDLDTINLSRPVDSMLQNWQARSEADAKYELKGAVANTNIANADLTQSGARTFSGNGFPFTWGGNSTLTFSGADIRTPNIPLSTTYRFLTVDPVTGAWGINEYDPPNLSAYIFRDETLDSLANIRAYASTRIKGDPGEPGPIGLTGQQGAPGANFLLQGRLNTPAELPSTGNTAGNAYVIRDSIYAFTTGGAWINVGRFAGERGYGVAQGGAPGNVLIKAGTNDYTTQWTTPPWLTVEGQTLTRVGDQLSISGGNTITLPADQNTTYTPGYGTTITGAGNAINVNENIFSTRDFATQVAQATAAGKLNTADTSAMLSGVARLWQLPAAQIQADWAQTITTAKDFIKNKPVIAQANWNETNSNAPGFILNKPTTFVSIESGIGSQVDNPSPGRYIVNVTSSAGGTGGTSNYQGPIPSSYYGKIGTHAGAPVAGTSTYLLPLGSEGCDVWLYRGGIPQPKRDMGTGPYFTKAFGSRTLTIHNDSFRTREEVIIHFYRPAGWLGNTYDTSSVNYFNRLATAGYAIHDTDKVIANTAIIGYKQSGYWDANKDLWLHIWSNAAANAVPLKGVAPNIVWNGTVTHATNGVASDGTTGYGDLGVSPATSFTALNNGSISVYVTTNTNNGSAIGTISGASSRVAIFPRVGSEAVGDFYSRIQTASNTDSRGLWTSNRTSQTDFRLWKNAVQIGPTLTTSTTNNNTSFNFFLLGLNNAGTGANSFSTCRVALTAVGNRALTEAEITAANAITEQLMDAKNIGIQQ